MVSDQYYGNDIDKKATFEIIIPTFYTVGSKQDR